MTDLAPKGDIGGIIARSIVGAIPVFGQLATEVVDLVIRNQRIDRIERLLLALEARLDRLDPAAVRARLLGEPVFTDLFEDALWQAARALSQERIEHIASVIANGLAAPAARAVEHKTVLRLLAEIDDAEVVVLAWHLQKNADDAAFYARHEALLSPAKACMGCSIQELDDAALQQARYEHLVNLGLLRNRYTDTSGRSDFIEELGGLKITGRDLSHLGRLLLRRIDLATEDEL